MGTFIVPYFVVQYFVFFIVLQSSLCGRERNREREREREKERERERERELVALLSLSS